MFFRGPSFRRGAVFLTIWESAPPGLGSESANAVDSVKVLRRVERTEPGGQQLGAATSLRSAVFDGPVRHDSASRNGVEVPATVVPARVPRRVRSAASVRGGRMQSFGSLECVSSRGSARLRLTPYRSLCYDPTTG
jgi:hypothetical protein